MNVKNKSTEEKWLLPFCIGDNAGSGFPTILDVWKSEGWIKPELIEDTNFDQVTLMMKMEKESDDESAENQQNQQKKQRIQKNESNRFIRKEELLNMCKACNKVCNIDSLD